MSSDASLPPNAPMANGLDHGHGEADASTTLSEVCADMHNRVSAFLAASPKSDTTRRTQEQTRISLGVIEKALQDYEYAMASIFHPCNHWSRMRMCELMLT
jgi:FAD synthetase